jgi:tryptophan synthase beta subunit
MRFVSADSAVRELINEALSLVERGRLRPYGIEPAEKHVASSISLGLTTEASFFLTLDQTIHGVIWVSIRDASGEIIDSWSSTELEHTGVGTATWELWELCRRRCYTTDTEEALEGLREQFSQLDHG